MNEIGYEDCDYISHEIKWMFWPNLMKDFNNKNKNNLNNSTLTLELHVPCREPLQHLMSMASHHSKIYECDENETNITIEKAIDEVYMIFAEKERFNNLIKTNVELKCFHSFPMENYINYMKDKLRIRRFVPTYTARTTNDKRDKSKECLWDNTSYEYKQKAIQLLIHKYPYPLIGVHAYTRLNSRFWGDR
jgi:hypothetical protein